MRVAAKWKRGLTLKRFTVAVLGATMLLVAGGCTTQQQVKQIVDESNARLAATMLPDPGLAPDAVGRTTGAADTARRIDEIIAANPDQKALAASLRIRQGVIYLNEDRYNLAEAAFESADAAQLFTDRDQALKALAPDLVWWYQTTARKTRLSADERRRATQAREAMKSQVAARKDSPDVRDWIAETGAWIGLAQAAAVPELGQLKSVLETTIDDYAVILTPADLEWLCTRSQGNAKVLLPDLRRRLRTAPIIEKAAEYAKQLTAADRPVFKDAVLQDLIARTSSTPRCPGK